MAAMTEECGADSVGAAGMLLVCKKFSRSDFAKSNGLFLLIEGKSVLATAMVSCANQLSFIWTPKPLRRKGYAATLLRMIGEVWESNTTLLPLWICADQGIIAVPKAAGWVNDGILNRDGTQDFFPPSLAPRYICRRAYSLGSRLDFGDTMETFLRLNKNPHVEEGKEWDAMMNKWRPQEVRKVLTGARV